MEFIYEKDKIYLDENNEHIAYITFSHSHETTINITETFVDESLRGHGVAEKLMIAVLDLAEEKNWKVKATCPYAISWIQRHPEKSHLYA